MMVRGRPSRRRVHRLDEEDDDSDEGSSTGVSSQPTIDPKIALQMADLGNNARDRLTAHDMERDRNINFAQIYSTRKCNQKGTTEANNAAANREKITGWNGFGGIDSTTNLDDIARGQYHRIATSQKVQEEVRQLRILGKEINAESVDEFHVGSSARQSVAVYTKRGAGQQRPIKVSDNASKHLDPAIDPNRVYGYKNKSKSGSDRNQPVRGLPAVRGGYNASRGGLHTGRGRLAHINVDFTQPSIPLGFALPISAESNSLGGRAAKQRRVQDRPWPPSALLGNPEILQGISDDNINRVPLPHTCQTALLKEPAKASAGLPISQVTADEQVKKESKNGSLDHTTSSTVSTITSSVKNRQPMNDCVKLADDFSTWFQSTSPAKTSSRDLSATQKTEAKSKTSANAEIGDQNVVVISREELFQGCNKGAKDNLTDGRLTPVDLSDVFGDQDINSTAKSILADKSPTWTSLLESPSQAFKDNAEDLMDVEIPEGERKALDIQSQVHKTTDDYHRAHPEGQMPEHVKPAASGNTPQMMLATNTDFLHRPNPFDRFTSLASTERDQKSPMKVALDSHDVFEKGINVGDRRQSPLKEAQQNGGSTSQPLEVRSPNVVRGDSVAAAKLAGSSPYLQSVMSDTLTQEHHTSRASTTLGDCSNLARRAAPGRFVNKTLRQSRFAPASPQQLHEESTPTIKHIPTGPGFALLVEELAKKNICVRSNRRPDEPAFVQQPMNGAFTEYREPVGSGYATEDDEL